MVPKGAVRALCLLVAPGVLWCAYLLRIRGLQRQFGEVVEARVAERTRIARELHDTLLQSFHGLMFRFQAARNMLPRRPEQAMETLDSAITRTEQALAESRDAIKDLRGSSSAQRSLAESIAALGHELAEAHESHQVPAIFDVTVEGQPRPLIPIIQDEVLRIVHEVLINAFRHAEAKQIEAELRYDGHALQVRVRDDGKGIEPEVLQMGRRAGHWGLPGIRERARRIGSKLDFWSEAGAGTEIQVTVPAAVAYEKVREKSRFGFARRWRDREQRP